MFLITILILSQNKSKKLCVLNSSSATCCSTCFCFVCRDHKLEVQQVHHPSIRYLLAITLTSLLIHFLHAYIAYVAFVRLCKGLSHLGSKLKNVFVLILFQLFSGLVTMAIFRQ